MDKTFWMICITHMFLETFFLVQVALIPIFVRDFHLSLFEASFVATFPSLIQLFMHFPSGFLADRFNTRYLLFASMLIEGLSALIISQINNFWLLVLGVSLMRMTSSLYHICGLSQISRLVKKDKMNRSMGIHNAMGSLGAAIGLVSLAILLSIASWRWNYAIWAIPIIVWGFILLKSHHFEAKMTKDSGTKKIVLRKFSFVFSTEFLVFMAIVALRMMETTGISTFMTTYLVDMRKLSESVASLIFGLGPFIGIVGSLVGGYLGEKMGARKALSLVMAGCILSLAILSMSTQIYMIMLVYLVYAFFGNSLWSPMTAMMTEVTPLTERGMGFSVYFFTEGITASITPALVAAIIGLFDVWYIFPFSITPLIAALFMVQLLSRYQKSLK